MSLSCRLVLACKAAPDLTLGTAIALAFPRSPMITANIAWDLAAFTEANSFSASAPRSKPTSPGVFLVSGCLPAPESATTCRPCGRF